MPCAGPADTGSGALLLWEKAAVEPEGVPEREHGVTDLATLLAIICLALVTWSYLSDAAGVPPWKLYMSVAIAWLLGLAALTRHPNWSTSIRCLTGGWMVAAPYLLAFTNIAPARWAYLVIGTIVTVVAVPGIATARRSRTRIAACFAR
jgi:hypothetical protein